MKKAISKAVAFLFLKLCKLNAIQRLKYLLNPQENAVIYRFIATQDLTGFTRLFLITVC